jgi:hypothetical protein
MTGPDADIVAVFEQQAVACASMDAPFTASVCRVLGANLTGDTAFERRVRDWRDKSLLPDLMPLRCCAALNTLVRRGKAPSLAAHYPPHAGDDDAALWRAIAATIEAHDAEMTAFLDSPPQTNEVLRSAVLLGGFLQIAAATRMPLALYELGASAGLNLLFDHYSFDLDDGRLWGPSHSLVHLVCRWSGRPPTLETPLSVASRAAVDLRPVDARSRTDRERMLAYIWPEQFDRIRRIEAALDVVAASSLCVEQGDALGWLRDRMAQPPQAHVCRTVYHSVFLQYLPNELRDALRSELQAIGERATVDAPFAWLAMEAAPDGAGCELRLTIWPGGKRRLLAKVDWHGRRAQWD